MAALLALACGVAMQLGSSQAGRTLQASMAPAPAPSCGLSLSPEVTQGPYYIETEIFRDDIREDQAGVPLALQVTVVDTNCQPIPDAFVDIWHCNATGTYSGFTGAGNGVAGSQTDDLTFLRGITVTDDNGLAVIDTIVPGWYAGRATHIHAKVHVPNSNSSVNTTDFDDETHTVHTGQFFISEALNEQIALLQPYVQHNSTARLTNEEDGIYNSSGDTLLAITETVPGSVEAGLVGSIVVMVNEAASYSDEFSMGGGGMPGAGSMPTGTLPRAMMG